jgi:8-oxo-dGTP pyrophosphatase MutT (NUDIX family)
VQSLAAILGGRLAREEPDAPGLRWAAVALVLRGTSLSESELLFIRRAEREGDPWSGHVAFPGGRFDVTDASLEQTARRETREELSLDLHADATLIGVLDDLRPRSGELTPNYEVHSTFWMPIAALRDPATLTEYAFDRGGARLRFPAYRSGDDVVWGMTERLVTQLLTVAADPG